MAGEELNSTAARLLQKARALGGRADVPAARVVRIANDFNQATALESGNDAAYGGRLDLLGGSECSERFGAGKDQH